MKYLKNKAYESTRYIENETQLSNSLSAAISSAIMSKNVGHGRVKEWYTAKNSTDAISCFDRYNLVNISAIYLTLFIITRFLIDIYMATLPEFYFKYL